MQIGSVVGVGALVLGLTVVAATAAADGAADVATIDASRVQIDLEQHLVENKYVLFDFYADWCAACRQIAPAVHRIAAQYPADLALRKLDIKTWQAPVVERYDIGGIPHFMLYGRDGKLMVQGAPERVLKVLRERLDQSGTAPATTSADLPPAVGAIGVMMTGLMAVVGYFLWSRRPTT